MKANPIPFRSVARALGIAGLAAAWLVPIPATASERMASDVEALTRHAHRLAGTDACAAAADHVASRLRGMGIADVVVQTFDVPQTVVRHCEMTSADGALSLPLEPMRPNGIRPATTPPEGITGPLLYVGNGSLAALAGKNPYGAIAVMDYDASDRWLSVFRLGARAIVFTSSGTFRSDAFHSLMASANLPRFYHHGPASDLPDGTVVTIRSQVDWQMATGRNVMALLPGTDPVFDLGHPEALVLAAALDSYGEVPRRSPGARGAANCAALLQLAEHLAAHRPRRDVVLLFVDGQARSHAGASAFYWALDTEHERGRLEALEEARLTEATFIEEMLKLAESPAPLQAQRSSHGKELLNRLKTRAEDASDELKEQLATLRKERERVRDEDASAVEGLQARIDALESAKDQWNELRRDLGRGSIRPENQPLFADILGRLAADIRLRQAELNRDQAHLATWRRLRELLGKKWITLHMSLGLGDTSDRWGVIVGGNSGVRSMQDQVGLYGRVQRSFLRAYESLQQKGRAPQHFEPASVNGALQDPRLLWGNPFLYHSGEMAGRYGIYNIVLGTMHERLPREGTPADTADRLDLDAMARNTAEIALMLAAVADQETRLVDVEAVADQTGLSLRRAIPLDRTYVVPGFRAGRPTGAMVMGRTGGSSFPDTPVPNAVVNLCLANVWYKLFWPYSKAPAFDDYIVLLTDRNGSYRVGPLPSDEKRQPVRGHAFAFDAQGGVIMASDKASILKATQRLNTFPSYEGMLMLPPVYWPQDASFMNALANAVISGDTEQRAYTASADGVAHWYTDRRITSYKVFGIDSIVALGEQESTETGGDATYGVGLPLGTDWLSIRTSRQSARDLWSLNERRLGILRARDVMNSSIEELHGRAEDLLAESERAEEATRRESLEVSSFMSSKPVYDLVRTTMDDLIKAVLILLALCVPFAFALERLLVGATSIYRQVAWFSVFFIATFLLLYSSHPAFAIAATPVIIFLGFAVVLLSVLVIFIIMQKFQVEIKALQGMTATVHSADVSRFSTVMAAMSMGISTMRRRPLRTALTAVTILLLTFTILCFASFDTRKGIVRIFDAPSPGYAGVALHNPNWGSYNQEFVDTLRARWGAEATLCPRYWVCPEFVGNPDFLIARGDGSRPVSLKGMLGLSPAELSLRQDLRALLGIERAEEIEGKVFMTDAVAALLGVEPGDPVLVTGRPFTVGPLLTGTALSAARDMDGNSILPVDFITMSFYGSTPPAADDLLQAQQTWTSLPNDAIVLLAADAVHRLGGKVHMISAYTPSTEASARMAEDLARMLDRKPVTATRDDGVYRHVLGTVVAASGVGDLFFPILLGGLVIFGTMLGSVADREKEIYTFSALGLAPPHVASLFFSEAMVYSVLGGMGGYLLAQASLKVLGLLAEQGLLLAPEMNYSSTNAIVTILIVMATVLISAIYPAIKASRSANPGLLRTWKLPPPDGDVFDLTFPFTVSQYDLTGVVSFLKEHFENFSDTGLGSFMARGAKLMRYDDGNLGVGTHLALAPFDLGVTQQFELRSQPSEIPGIDEVRIRLQRLSGQPKDWARLNKVLLDDLRTQFLLWRALPAETMEMYRARTLQQAAAGGEAREPR